MVVLYFEMDHLLKSKLQPYPNKIDQRHDMTYQILRSARKFSGSLIIKNSLNLSIAKAR